MLASSRRGKGVTAAARRVIRRPREALRGRVFAVKMSLLALTLAVPVVGFATVLTQQKHAQIDLASRERIGLGYALRNETVLHELRGLRDSVAIDGQNGAPERKRVQYALNRLYTYSSTTGRDLSLLKELERFQIHWSAVAAGSRSPNVTEATKRPGVQLFHYVCQI